MGVALMFVLMGQYERGRRSDRVAEFNDKFAKLSQEIPDLEKLSRLPVMYSERVQPLDTVARSEIRKLTGKRKIYGVDPVLVFLSLAFDDESFGWDDIPVILVQHGRNKEWLGVHSADNLATVANYKKSQEIGEKLIEVRQEAQANPQALSSLNRELLNISGNVREIQNNFQHLFRLVPPTRAQQAADTKTQDDWHLTAECLVAGHDPKAAKEIRRAFDDLGEAWRSRDMDAINERIEFLTKACGQLNPSSFPSTEDIERELTFSRVKPFNYSSYFYFAASVFCLFGMVLSMKLWLRIGIIASLLGLSLHAWGFYMRTTLGFGVTITNLYESMVAVAGGIMLICLIIDLFRKSGWATIAGGLCAFLVLQIVDLNSVKFNDAIGGTIAVLANNVWVHIHVPVVMTAYAAYLMAFCISIVTMTWILFVDRKAKSPSLVSMLKTATIAVDLGSVFMLAGLVLGGIWAAESWGRFWDWDPKETWAFVLFVYYVIIIHGRHTKWMNPFWASVLMFGGGKILLWTYYGTNELLSGLHSYANSSGEGSFWANLVHERNRWFVYTDSVLTLIVIVAIAIYFLYKPKDLMVHDEEPSDDKATRAEQA